jgi:hypothetical protein
MKPHKEVSRIAGMTALVFPRYVLYSSPMHHEPQAFFHSKVILLLPLQTFLRTKRLHACGEIQVGMLQGKSYELVEDKEWVDPLLALVGYNTNLQMKK